VFAFEAASSALLSAFVYPLSRLQGESSTHPLIFPSPLSPSHNSPTNPNPSAAYLFRRFHSESEQSNAIQSSAGNLKLVANYESAAAFFESSAESSPERDAESGWVSIENRVVLYRPGRASECNMRALRGFYHQRGIVSYCWGCVEDSQSRSGSLQERMGYLLRSNRPEVCVICL
jgi:hypothetical protein